MQSIIPPVRFTFVHGNLRKLRKVFIVAFLIFCGSGLQAQILNPVHVTSSLKNNGSGLYDVVFDMQIDDGFHVYSLFVADSVPVKTIIHFDTLPGFHLQGAATESATASGKKFQKKEPLFNDATLIWFENHAQFRQKIKLTTASANVSGYLEYMTCNDRSCLPPKRVPFSFQLKNAVQSIVSPPSVDSSHASAIQKKDTGENLVIGLSRKNDSIASAINSNPDSKESLHPDFSTQTTVIRPEENENLWEIFLAGLGSGFIALLQPCVFPVIPLTVSFFLKQNKNKRRGRMNAILYGISILVIFIALGLIVTLLFGPSALNSLSSSLFFNLLFFVIFFLFALSFLGVFEIRLPAAWINKSEQTADRGGLLGIFFMAFTLVLVSFSCTLPIIGNLLPLITQGSAIKPLVGLGAFGLALALPFAIFALFPNLLKSLPKSGGWMNTLKVSLGFIEMALALIYLSKVDLAYHWGLLSRDVFLVFWIVISAFLGFYLAGKIRLAYDEPLQHISVGRLLCSILAFSFALYLTPGLFGAPLKLVSGYLPPLGLQEFNLNEPAQNSSADPAGEEAHKYAASFPRPHNLNVFFDYDEGIAYAKKSGKPVMLDFTGWACVNCRKMEADVWSDPQVLKTLRDDYVLISLYVDDKTKLSDSDQYTSPFSKQKIETLGDRNSDLQARWFGSNSQPYYVLIDPGKTNEDPERLLNSPHVFDLNIDSYIGFLDSGLKEYASRKKSS